MLDTDWLSGCDHVLITFKSLKFSEPIEKRVAEKLHISTRFDKDLFQQDV